MADVPANTSSKAVLEGAPDVGTYSGRLEKPGDHDWIKIEVGFGVPVAIYACMLNDGSVADGDTTLRVRDAAGTELDFNDDGGVGVNSFLSFTPPASGIFFIDVGEFEDNAAGSYSIFVTMFAGTNKERTDNSDTYIGLADERILGGKGNDIIGIGAGRQALGEQGNDSIGGNGLQNLISGGIGNDTITGEGGQDFLFGDAGRDRINGGADIDDIHGGAGKDFLTGGTHGDDFHFSALSHSKRGAQRDVITDFTGADTIDLTAIDAKTGGGNQKFKFIGSQAFHDTPGELHFSIINLPGRAKDKTIVGGDVNGDGRADFEIELKGAHNLHPNDFDL